MDPRRNAPPLSVRILQGRNTQETSIKLLSTDLGREQSSHKLHNRNSDLEAYHHEIFLLACATLLFFGILAASIHLPYWLSDKGTVYIGNIRNETYCEAKRLLTQGDLISTNSLKESPDNVKMRLKNI